MIILLSIQFLSSARMNGKAYLYSLLILLGLFVANATLATKPINNDYSGQREFFKDERAIFKKARRAIARGDEELSQTLRDQIRDYPIAFFLDYEQLKYKLSKANNTKVQDAIVAFQNISPDQALTGKLYRKLLNSLAKKEKWDAYIQVRNFDQLGRQCDVLLALVKTGTIKSFNKMAKSLWLNQISHSDSCRLAFRIIQRHEPVTTAMVWSRIYRLIEKGQTSEITEMLRYLSTSDKLPIKAWAKAYPDPAKYLSGAEKTLHSDTGVSRRVLISLIMRWAKRDALQAHAYWQKLRKRYAFSNAARTAVDRLIARMAAFDGLEQAHEWLHQLPSSVVNKSVRHWRIRTAMRNLDWKEVLRDINSLPEKEKLDNQWRYWLARALEETGKKNEAASKYQVLAKTQSYHGFLAADQLGLKYHLGNSTKQAKYELKANLAKNKTLIRAREYEYAGLAWEGRREWMSVVNTLDNPEQFAAAELAKDWGWADRAVFSVAKTGVKEALELRFPMPHTTEVQQASSLHSIESALIYGVIRRESGFIEDIRSGAGAIGLMQLMPSTARDVVRWQGKKSVGNLSRADTNIRLGSYYLRYVLNKFNNNQPLATAAYNAGPSRVKRWLPQEHALSADVWVDTIPYSETRRYVRAVMAYTTIFEWRMNQQVTRLNKRMPTIHPNMVLSQS